MRCPKCGSKECCGAEMDIEVQSLKRALEELLEIAGYTGMSDAELREDMLRGNGVAKPILMARAALRGE